MKNPDLEKDGIFQVIAAWVALPWLNQHMGLMMMMLKNYIWVCILNQTFLNVLLDMHPL